MEKKFRYMLIIKCLILFLIVTAMIGIFWPKQYPTTKNIDTFFSEYQNLSSKQQITNLKIILEKLSDPKTVSDDNCLEYFINRLQEEFLVSEDDAILIALDQTDIDAGFANYVCSFYNSVKNTERFRNRYSSNPQTKQRAERCVGLSYSDTELQKILSGNHSEL